LDFFILSEDSKMVTVYSLDSGGERYRASEVSVYAENGHLIVGASVGDFNHDGFLDLLLSQKRISGGGGSGDLIHHRMYFGDGESLKLSGWKIPDSKDHLMLLDSRGRMLIDFLGVPTSSSELMIWSAQSNDPSGLVSGYELEPLEHSCPAWRPQSHAFADFNGDGLADILLVCRGPKDENYLKLLLSSERLPSRATYDDAFPAVVLPTGHGPVSVGDFDANGSMDLIFAVCDPPGECSRENSLHILYNTQKPFCTSPTQKNCKHLADLMESDKSFTGFTTTTNNNQLIINFPIEEFAFDATVPLAIGDYNVNGYPDVLAVVMANGHEKIAVLLENFLDLTTGRRSLRRASRGVKELEKQVAVQSVAFLNLYQEGPPDILLNLQSSVQTLQNGFVQDTFFLRTETLNAVCPAPCMSKKTGSVAHRPYGASFPGPTVKFSFTDFDGSLRVRCGAQLAQSGGPGRLTSPWQFFGLGRTNNFVELLAVRTPSRLNPNLARKAGLVPNSDLIINAPHADSPNAFHFELHILPGQYFLWVLTSIATAMIVLGSLTAFFKWREIKEDNEERRKALHSINFDAL
jgi:integrin alpha FG-GAP repeat containing protein 1